MVTLSDIKTYLRIDDSDNDDLLILLKDTAISQMRNTITDFDNKYTLSAASTADFVKIADLCTVILVAELYDQRIGGGANAIRYSYIAGNMLEVLEYYSGDGIEEVEDG